MNFDRRIILLFTTAIVVILFLLVGVLINREPPPGSPLGAIERNAAGHSPIAGGPLRVSARLEPMRSVTETPERWRTIAKGTALPLVSPLSLALGEGVIGLLELNPTEVKGLNEDLAAFVELLRAAEKRNAYVQVGSDGSEELVVTSFDRGPLIKQFRKAVEQRLGKNVADFCAEQMLYDRCLALGNAEVRIFIEPKGGVRGHDMLVVSRGVQRRNPSEKFKWEGDAAPPLTSKTIAGKDFGIRYRHLFYLANKGKLPRKQEGAK
jgi:hypothetical protein